MMNRLGELIREGKCFFKKNNIFYDNDIIVYICYDLWFVLKLYVFCNVKMCLFWYKI